MRWTLIVIVALTGCNQLFGLKDVVPTDASGNVIPCAPLAFDAARYRAKAQPNAAGYSWQTARTGCLFDGYDLAVLNAGDNDELSNESLGAVVPFWLGLKYGTDWTAIDGCMPALDWGMGEPSDSAIDDCALKSALGLRSDSCQNMIANGLAINALCETPRPSIRCLQLQAERNYMSVAGNVSHVDAETACSALGMHILEIDSSDELDYVRGHFPGIPSFWLGAAKGGGTFTSPTGCPQVWAWGPNDPDMTNSCVAYAQGAMESYDCNTATPGVICESNTL